MGVAIAHVIFSVLPIAWEIDIKRILTPKSKGRVHYVPHNPIQQSVAPCLKTGHGQANRISFAVMVCVPASVSWSGDLCS